MKVDMSNAPDDIKSAGVAPGNVYQTQKGTLYLVVAVDDECSGRMTGTYVVALVVQRDGSITNAVRYGSAYFEGRPIVGRMELPETLTIEWLR